MDRFALAGFVFGLLAAACFVVLLVAYSDVLRYVFGIFSVVGFGAGCLGMYRAFRKPERTLGFFFAFPGILFCFVGLALFGLTFVSREGDGRKPRCSNNLKQLGIIFRMLANDNPEGLYPPLSPEPGRLMFDNDAAGYNRVFPDYLTDFYIMFCPKGKSSEVLERRYDYVKPDVDFLLDDHCFFYLGYAVTCDEDVVAFARAYKERIGKGQAFEDDIPNGRIRRLRASMAENVQITNMDIGEVSRRDSLSHIPVLIERLGNHDENGGNVLYLDGHVEFVSYPWHWPMTERTVAVLKELDSMGTTE